MLSVKPLRGFVLVEPEKTDEKSSGGVYLPEISQEKPAKGKIVGIGLLGIKVTNHDYLKKGDIVYFKKWGGETIKEDGKEYVFVKFEDLLGIVE